MPADDTVPASGAASTARLFYALWPEPPLREALLAHQRAWSWPPGVSLTRPERLHMTLHFLGELPRALLPALAAALPPAQAPFGMLLAQPVLWRGGLAVLLAPEAPAALVELHSRLAAALHALGLPTETRPFAPHVTLARRAHQARPPLQFDPIPWTARGAVLVESVRPHGGYRVLAEAPG
ncbi:RNA 2',3'-cyclic phosphodiesterase [Caldimonas tepidiphila]|uniref:RNA 2',3'-cyclic phosphodiesterase n=1 Tax=Caldimonas tepidiphila TaxID=2315841 RepID=UPI0013009A3A|nr:RNA 2',3'-cyclic phosphodiesterase [Caldimonas tepidiphila]